MLKITTKSHQRFFKFLSIIDSLRNRVVSTRVKRVATQHSPYSHPAPFERAILINGFIAVMRASWIKTAGIGGQSFRKGLLIQTNEHQQQPPEPISRGTRQVLQRGRLRVGGAQRKIQGGMRVRMTHGVDMAPVSVSSGNRCARRRSVATALRIAANSASAAGRRAIKSRSYPTGR